MPPRTSVWLNAREAVTAGDSKAVLALACPKCGGSLSITFIPDSPQPDGTTAGLIKVTCWHCTSGTMLDGLSYIPQWVETIGNAVKTQPTSKPNTAVE